MLMFYHITETRTCCFSVTASLPLLTCFALCPRNRWYWTLEYCGLRVLHEASIDFLRCDISTSGIYRPVVNLWYVIRERPGYEWVLHTSCIATARRASFANHYSIGTQISVRARIPKSSQSIISSKKKKKNTSPTQCQLMVNCTLLIINGTVAREG